MARWKRLSQLGPGGAEDASRNGMASPRDVDGDGDVAVPLLITSMPVSPLRVLLPPVAASSGYVWSELRPRAVAAGLGGAGGA